MKNEQTNYDILVIGGGIVGLATAMEISNCFPQKKIAVLEKESELATHQTGRNSGVIHSGIYYRPGSLKAKTCVRGVELLKQFCRDHHVPIEETGKVIVATNNSQLDKLQEIYQRGVANQVPGIEIIDANKLKEIEPHANGVRAIWVPSTGIVDYAEVCEKFAQVVRERGGKIFVDAGVTAIETGANGLCIKTNKGRYQCRYLINCAGLHSDRIARLGSCRPHIRIVPFRGEYYRLLPDRNFLVKGLIYPVPDPSFPFLGVHFTKMIDGGVEVGPNAVLAFKREGYSKTSFSFFDSWEIFTYLGFWLLALKYWKKGIPEMVRSFSKRLFVKDARHLVPEVTDADLTPYKAGVRAQALDKCGKLIDDFCIETTPRMIHVLNAPSPAATASIAISHSIVAMAREQWQLA